MKTENKFYLTSRNNCGNRLINIDRRKEWKCNLVSTVTVIKFDGRYNVKEFLNRNLK